MATHPSDEQSLSGASKEIETNTTSPEDHNLEKGDVHVEQRAGEDVGRTSPRSVHGISVREVTILQVLLHDMFAYLR